MKEKEKRDKYLSLAQVKNPCGACGDRWDQLKLVRLNSDSSERPPIKTSEKFARIEITISL